MVALLQIATIDICNKVNGVIVPCNHRYKRMNPGEIKIPSNCGRYLMKHMPFCLAAVIRMLAIHMIFSI